MDTKVYEVYFENETEERINKLEERLGLFCWLVTINPVKRFFFITVNHKTNVHEMLKDFNVTIKDVTGFNLIERYR